MFAPSFTGRWRSLASASGVPAQQAAAARETP